MVIMNIWESIQREIERHDWIGFDLFDTLLLRPFLTPDDLFYQMEEQLGIADFAMMRTKTENQLRWNRKRELTLQEIYDAMQQSYHQSNAVVQSWMQLECAMELQYCYPRESGMRLFHAAKTAGKKIAIITDMYLPTAQIEQMLQKIGADTYDRLYLSSALGKSKANGGIYQLLKQEKMRPDRFLQIGDNRIADVEIPKCLGFHAVHLPSAYAKFRQYGRVCSAVTDVMPSLAVRCATALAVNTYFDDPFRSLCVDADWNADPYYMGLFFPYEKHLPSVVQQNPKFQAGQKRAIQLHIDFFGKVLPHSETAVQLVKKYVTKTDRMAFAEDENWIIGQKNSKWIVLPEEKYPSRLQIKLRLLRQKLL